MNQELRIVSDGTPGGTKVMDRHGREVKGVKSVSWSINVETGESEATITLECVPAYLDGVAVVMGQQAEEEEEET